jgi:hypothetical protein
MKPSDRIWELAREQRTRLFGEEPPFVTLELGDVIAYLDEQARDRPEPPPEGLAAADLLFIYRKGYELEVLDHNSCHVNGLRAVAERGIELERQRSGKSG